MIIFLGNQSGSNSGGGVVNPPVGGGATANITVLTGDQLNNFNILEDTTYLDLGYSYKIEFYINGLSANDIADINFQPDLAVSGLVSPFAETTSGRVSAWLKTNNIGLDTSKTSIIVNNI